MRITFYLIFISVIFFSFSSCSKGDLVQEPRFGTVSVKNATTESIAILQNGKPVSLAPGADLDFNIVSGHQRFRFYIADTLQSDTVLAVVPFSKHAYVLFKSGPMTGLGIYDASFNGLSTTVLPDSGRIKISLANFSSSLPGKVNAYLTTKTYVGNVQKEIQVGEFLMVNSIFSDFKTIMLGTGLSSRPQNLYVLTIKDPVDNRILATSSITFPNVTATGALVSTVYLLYLDANNNISTLMSK